MASRPIYQFYAELTDYKPRMWRRFQIVDNVSMAKLGYVVMTMFEMDASHLFCIEVPKGENMQKELRKWMTEKEMRRDYDEDELTETLRYEVQDEETQWDETSRDAVRTLLYRVISEIGEKLYFYYDFGDGWEVTLLLEAVIVDKELPARELPRVLEGEGFGIVVDCGGPGGLMELAEVFEAKQGE
ncbi:MAG: plasmid pRiA4b ORF-3 family protein [Christensenellales bacterium]|jgi:hypothetical protein